jgi:hypothetical protein
LSISRHVDGTIRYQWIRASAAAIGAGCVAGSKIAGKRAA